MAYVEAHSTCRFAAAGAARRKSVSARHPAARAASSCSFARTYVRRHETLELFRVNSNALGGTRRGILAPPDFHLRLACRLRRRRRSGRPSAPSKHAVGGFRRKHAGGRGRSEHAAAARKPEVERSDFSPRVRSARSGQLESAPPVHVAVAVVAETPTRGGSGSGSAERHFPACVAGRARRHACDGTLERNERVRGVSVACDQNSDVGDACRTIVSEPLVHEPDDLVERVEL